MNTGWVALRLLTRFAVMTVLWFGACTNATEPLNDDVFLALTSRRDGNDEVYLVDDAGGFRNLTLSDGEDRDPVWSPDGERLVFVSGQPGERDIFLVEGTGGRARNLTDHPTDDFDPVWSPDGSVIAFVSERDGNQEIYLLDWRNDIMRNLTGHQARDFDPAWSSDGRVAFASGRGLGVGIFTVDLQPGAEPAAVPGPAGDNTAPVWSQNDDAIAFESNADGASDIYVIQLTDTVALNLSQHAAHDRQPIWSPDGSVVAFLSNRDGNWEIYSATRDGTSVMNLTQIASSEARPVWSPDGSQIAFETQRNGNWDVFVMAPDGSGVRAVTTNAANDGMPAWRPR